MANFTEMMIMQTFIKLLEERSFNKITVKDIINETGISRNTFYYHFQDIYDLATKVADQELERMDNVDFSQVSLYEVIKQITVEANKSKKQIYHMINTVDRKSLETFIYNKTYRTVGLYIEETLQGYVLDQTNKEVVQTCYTCAIVGVIMKWFDDGMKDDVEFLEKAIELFTGSMAQAFKNGN